MSQLEMPLYQQIYDEIKHAIDNGIYVPGDKIQPRRSYRPSTP